MIVAFYSAEWPIDAWQPHKSLRSEYDGVLFIPITTAARPTPSDKRGPRRVR